MSNRQKGELPFTVDGKSYTLHFSVNALCALESATGLKVMAISEAMSDPAQISMITMRSLFRSGLSDHHPELSDIDAGKIMTALGQAQAMDLVSIAFSLAFPVKADDVADPPLQPTAGTAATAPDRGPGLNS